MKTIVAQIGAREHYAIARALHQQSLLAGLVTDLPLRFPGVPTYGLDDVGAIAARITTLTALARPQAAS